MSDGVVRRPELSPRPEDVGASDVQRAVRERVRLSFTPEEVVNVIVWETLAVLGEWDLIELEAKNAAARRLLEDE